MCRQRVAAAFSTDRWGKHADPDQTSVYPIRVLRRRQPKAVYSMQGAFRNVRWVLIYPTDDIKSGASQLVFA